MIGSKKLPPELPPDGLKPAGIWGDGRGLLIAGFVAIANLGTGDACRMFYRWVGKIGLEQIMKRSARIGLAAALLVGGATIAMAQNGPATGGYPPARWNPNFYGHYGYSYYPRYYGYYPVYPAVPGYWDYYQTSAPGRGSDEESTR